MYSKWLIAGFALTLTCICSIAHADFIVVAYNDAPTGALQDSGNNEFSFLALSDLVAADEFWISDGPGVGGEYRIRVTLNSDLDAGTILNFNGEILSDAELTDGIGNVINADLDPFNPAPPALSQPGPVYIYRSNSALGTSADDPLASFNIDGGTPFGSPANAVDFRGTSLNTANALAYNGTQVALSGDLNEFIPLIQDPNNWIVQTDGTYAPPSGVFAIPEPAATGVILFALGCIATRRRR